MPYSWDYSWTCFIVTFYLNHSSFCFKDCAGFLSGQFHQIFFSFTWCSVSWPCFRCFTFGLSLPFSSMLSLIFLLILSVLCVLRHFCILCNPVFICLVRSPSFQYFFFQPPLDLALYIFIRSGALSCVLCFMSNCFFWAACSMSSILVSIYKVSLATNPCPGCFPYANYVNKQTHG